MMALTVNKSRMARSVLAAGLAAGLIVAAATPGEARRGWGHGHGRGLGWAGAGFAAGALVGAAAASNARGYYGGPAYYEPAPRSYYGAPEVYYSEPAPAYYGGRCWVDTDSGRGYGYYGPCRPETTDTLKSRNQ